MVVQHPLRCCSPERLGLLGEVTEAMPNLMVLEPSRRRQRVGDLFTLRPTSGPYLFGRVVRTDANAGGFPSSNLIYIFRVESDRPEPPDRAELNPSNLLVPPIMTNRLPWSRGYFQTIASWPIRPGEALARHCFEEPRRPPEYPHLYFDEYGASAELPGRVEPCGEWGLHSYLTIDDAVSSALAIPAAES